MLRLQTILPALALALAPGAFAQSTGTPFCNVAGNYTTLTGSFGSGVGSDLHLEVNHGVAGEFGYFLVGTEATSGVSVSNGLLCLVGTGTAQVFRYNVAGGSSNSVGRFGSFGIFQNLVGTSQTGNGFDVPSTVPGNMPITITGGSTWHFQLWHRDSTVQAGDSSFSNGLSVTFPVSGPVPVAGMVPIPAGTFTMGSNATNLAPYHNESNTQPVHSVTISESFWMSETEVTQAQYQARMGTNPSGFVGGNLPVESVGWTDAKDYCTALTEQERAAGNLPSGYEYRLPTEAEWEYTCRAGTTTEFNVAAELLCADARIGYSWHSNSSCGVSIFAGTVDVGSYAPNAFGLYDMHGNVREWCLDSFSTYGLGATTNPYSSGGSSIIIRGGSWQTGSESCRSAHRDWGSLGGSGGTEIGFRVVLVSLASMDPVAGMVQIPAGSFDMGSNATSGAPYFSEANERPVHSVAINRSFWMGEHEVTQAEYQGLMGVNPSHYSGANLPVETVTWNAAVAYCTELTRLERAAGNLSAGYEYRLPTEAEWEYACRAGTTTEFNIGANLFCVDARFLYSVHSSSPCGASSSIAVGSYSANAFGLYDMHGNAWEWCLDTFANYTPGAATDPFVTGGSLRVFRGGSWGVNSNGCRSAYRGNGSPGDSFADLGFRAVLAPVLVP